MHAFPMFFKTTDRRVVIVGGGEQAAQKARLILKTDAHIVLAAPELEPELAELVRSGRASQYTGPIDTALFDDAAMAFIATGCVGIDASAHAIARAARVPVNVVDQPALCDITTPAIVDRAPVVIAIGTEGTAPVLARQIKTKIEEDLPQTLGGLAALAGRLRGAVEARVPRAARRPFWRWVFAETPRRLWEQGAESHAATQMKAAIEAGGAPDRAETGSIALVGAGPGARDLLTLRAVQRLQEADVIFYDRLVGEDALELARRDAERIYVGKVPGAHAWPQSAINARIVAEAKKGLRVVRLKSGDPSVFGRAGEELNAARAEGISVEIVPGVTAATAAAASLGESLTERGRSSRLVLATGTSQDGTTADAGTRDLSPGTTVAFYMAVRQAAQIEADMLSSGVPSKAPVAIVANASRDNELQMETTVGALHHTVQTHGITGSAVILVTWPEGMAAEAVHPATKHFAVSA